jgi:hypothetical protein
VLRLKKYIFKNNILLFTCYYPFYLLLDYKHSGACLIEKQLNSSFFSTTFHCSSQYSVEELKSFELLWPHLQGARTSIETSKGQLVWTKNQQDSGHLSNCQSICTYELCNTKPHGMISFYAEFVTVGCHCRCPMSWQE